MNEKQLEIIEKASLVFMRNGVKSVTMDDLAKQLGMSKKTIYKFFKDKNDLIAQIMQSKVELDKMVCENVKVNAENAIDELIQISKFISEMFGEVHTSVFFDLQKYHREAWNIMENHKVGYVKHQILQNIQRGIDEGLYISDLKKEVIAAAYISNMDTIFENKGQLLGAMNLSEILTEIIRFQLRGMVNEKGLTYLKKRLTKEKHA